VKVGDLVKWENVLNDSMDHHREDHGIVVKMSRTGHDSESAQILFTDGELWWMDTRKLRIVNEAG
jgi:hypothetical protein